MGVTIAANRRTEHMTNAALANVERLANGTYDSPIDAALKHDPALRQRFNAVGKTKRPAMPSMQSMMPSSKAQQMENPASTTAVLQPHKGEYRGLRTIADFDTRRYDQADYLPIGLGFILYSGENDVGKSSVIERLAARVLLGETEGVWHGRPYGVLFVLSEEDPGTIKAAMQAHGVTDFIMQRNLYTYVTGDNDSPESGDYDTVNLPDDVPWLQTECRKRNIKMVVFDALVEDMASARINDRGDVSRAIKPLNKWAADENILVIGVHHNNKGADGNAKQAVSGSTAFTDKARVVVSLDKTGDGQRVMQLVKVKGQPGNPSFTYEFGTRNVATSDGGSKDVGIITSITPSDLQVNDIRAERSAQPPASAKRAANGEIIDWLTDYLDNDKVPFDQIKKDASAQEGYTAEQLRNARKASDGRISTCKDPGYKGRGQRFLWYIAADTD